MTYHEDVAFLQDANPALIGRSSAEFRRLHLLVDTADDAFRKAVKVDWQSDARELYAKRLKEAKELADALSAAFRTVGRALTVYAEAVSTARQHYRSGKSTESRLSEVMFREATASTPTARAAEPMKQWEDLRASTGVLDWFAELGVDVDAIREDAERYYGQTSGHFADALRIESEAREQCLADIRAAYRSLPDFESPIADPEQFLKHLGPLRAEARQAGDNPYVQLPGTGPKMAAVPVVNGKLFMSEALMRIDSRLAGLPEAQGGNYWLPSDDDEGRRAYVSANSAIIKAAAHDAGLPPEMVAGIAWKEVEGDPGFLDDGAFETRKIVPGIKDANETSVGSMSVQVRRAAEVLGYDPNHLTTMAQEEVVDALRDPGRNIFVASEYLAQVKAESSFADVPPEQLTREQMQELAARYNGGPYYLDPHAQRYGRQFAQHLDQAKEALG